VARDSQAIVSTRRCLVIISKPPGTGGLVNRVTVIEQLLYEIHDPPSYLTPDVVLDLGEVEIEQLGLDRVRVTGARGKPPTAMLKATVCVDAGWLGEGEISYAGPNALARAELAAAILHSRCRIIGINDPVRVEVLGTEAVFDSNARGRRPRVRIERGWRLSCPSSNAQHKARSGAKGVRRSAEPLLLRSCRGRRCVRQHVSPQFSTASILVDRDRVRAKISIVEAP
jgi:hypothetical protein